MSINWEAISNSGPMVVSALGILIAVVGVLFAVAKGLFGKRKPKHPDSKDVRLAHSEAFFVRMGERTATMDCIYTPRHWQIGISRLTRWQEPHQSEPITESDRESLGRKLKNVLEAEGSVITFD